MYTSDNDPIAPKRSDYLLDTGRYKELDWRNAMHAYDVAKGLEPESLMPYDVTNFLLKNEFNPIVKYKAPYLPFGERHWHWGLIFKALKKTPKYILHHINTPRYGGYVRLEDRENAAKERYDRLNKQYYEEALKFIQDYLASDGYLERYNNYIKNILSKDPIDNMETHTNIIRRAPLRTEHIPSYDIGNSALYVTGGGSRIDDVRYVKYPDYSVASLYDMDISEKDNGLWAIADYVHELGHALDDRTKVGTYEQFQKDNTTVDHSYVLTNPYVWKNHALQEFMKQNPGIAINMKNQKRIPHQALPLETYADYLRMLFLMKHFGIYDPFKGGDITKEMILKYRDLDTRSTSKPANALNYMDDDDIIEMNRNTAYNPTQDNGWITVS